MEGSQTTEALFANLDPQAREEAVRLAARLQSHGNDSVSLVAAAREAGIEDRYLREAVATMSSPTGRVDRNEVARPTLNPIRSVLPVLAMVLVTGFFVAATALHSGETGSRMFKAALFSLSAFSLAVGFALPAEIRRWKAAQYVFAVLAGITLTLLGLRFFRTGPTMTTMVLVKAAFFVLSFTVLAYMGAVASAMFHALRDAVKRSAA